MAFNIDDNKAGITPMGQAYMTRMAPKAPCQHRVPVFGIQVALFDSSSIVKRSRAQEDF